MIFLDTFFFLEEGCRGVVMVTDIPLVQAICNAWLNEFYSICTNDGLCMLSYRCTEY